MTSTGQPFRVRAAAILRRNWWLYLIIAAAAFLAGWLTGR